MMERTLELIYSFHKEGKADKEKEMEAAFDRVYIKQIF
jgi:hypothetical protein